MSGRITLAPCGHTGETIIGTYVKCLMGCEGAPVMNKRATPGHVRDCRCKPCQIRQRAVAIVLRTRDGKDFAKTEWNGEDDEIVIESKKSGNVTNYNFLDADGKVVAKGSTNATLYPGQARIKVKFMLNDAGTVSMTKGVIDMVPDRTLRGVTIMFNGKVITGAAPGVGYWVP